LKGALRKAQQAFLEVLDGYTLDQFLVRQPQLVQLLGASLRSGDAELGAR
jgi:hypothetical protein